VQSYSVSNSPLNFTEIQPTLNYRALLYELQQGGAAASVSPNWFGVAIPNSDHFDFSSNIVYIVLYFHPYPAQPGALFNNADYFKKGVTPPPTGYPTPGFTDWAELYGFADRLGGQMAAAEDYDAPKNRLVMFPFLETPSLPPANQYTLETSEWGNVIHDILQDIHTNVVPGVCTLPKKVVIASLSNGSGYLNQFLSESQSNAAAGQDSIFSNIVEVWDFDSDITSPPIPVDPHGIQLRAYWQNTPQPGQLPTGSDVVVLPSSSWSNFSYPNPPSERPPLPPNPGNSNPANHSDAANSPTLFHHYIRDTMFLDAASKIGS
jgi:hypothetical protein